MSETTGQTESCCPHCGYDFRGTQPDNASSAYRCPECGETTTQPELRDADLALWERSRRPPHALTFAPAIGVTGSVAVWTLGAVSTLPFELAIALFYLGLAGVFFAGLMSIPLFIGLASTFAIRRGGSARRFAETSRLFFETGMVNLLLACLGAAIAFLGIFVLAETVKAII